jgi:hypothetical protein
MSDDELDALIGPVCFLADLQTNFEACRKVDPWPADLDALVQLARKVKAGFGFDVVTVPTHR